MQHCLLQTLHLELERGLLNKTRNALNRVNSLLAQSSGLSGIKAEVTNGTGNQYFGTASLGNLGLNGMNASGSITGIFTDGNAVAHGFVRTADGGITTFDAPGAGTGSLEGTGSFAINASGLMVGAYADLNSVIHAYVLKLAQVATTTTLVSNPSSSIYGEPVTLTATVSSTGGMVPDGETVWFMSGTTTLGSQPLSGGTATLTPTTLPGGTDSITAIYVGDLNFAGSTSAAVNQVVSKASTATDVTSVQGPFVFGQPVVFTSNVTGQLGGVVTGTVSFSNNGTPLGTVAVSGNKASLTTVALPAGPAWVVAVYNGDGNFNGSTSSADSQTVNRATPSIVWLGPAAIASGTPLSGLQLNAIASVPGTFAYNPAAGTVLAAGAQSLGVTFTPTDIADYTTATASVPLTVNAVAASTPTVTVTPASFSITTAQALKVTVTVSGSGGTPTGSVVLSSGSYTSNAQTLASGSTVFEVPAGWLAVGPDTLTAAYTPNASSVAIYKGTTGNSAAVTVASAVVVTGATTTTLAVTAAGSPVTTTTAGSVVTLTATVKAGSAGVSTGLVNFCDASGVACSDIHLLGAAQLTSGGTATFKFKPGLGEHSYKAVFAGTKSNATSSSAVSELTVSASGVGSPSIMSISQGGVMGNYSLSATVGGFGNAAPTGTLSFLDATNGNAVLGTSALAANSSGVNLLGNQLPVTGNYFPSEVVGDFNGDGIPDVAIVNGDNNTVTILLGNGDGTFTQAANSPVQVGSAPNAIAVGDFNGDGIADLAVTNQGSNTVSILLGSGNGLFTAVGNPVSVGYNSSAIVVGDFNGDGIADLAVTNTYVPGSTTGNGTVTILLGNGSGAFTVAPNSPLTVGSDPDAVVVGDFNGDGVPDLAVANQGNNTVSILLGSGTGTFTQAANSPISAGYSPVSIAVGDFNGDGVLDLAVAGQGSSNLVILLGNGNGTFTASSSSPSTGGSNARSIVVGDFNGDGIADLAVDSWFGSAVNSNGNGVIQILLGSGNGNFTAATSSAIVEGSYPNYIVAGDFNGDGVSDLALLGGQYGSSTASVLLTAKKAAVATVTGISVAGLGPHQAVASYPGDSNYAAGVSGATSLYAPTPAPTFSLTSGTYTSTEVVDISDAAAGADIYYTTDGSTPVIMGGAHQYLGPITVSSSETITAMAVATGYGQSATASATYTLNLPAAATPVISPASGVYSSAITVTMTDASPEAPIYYTTNGAVPTQNSFVYSGPFTVSTSETVSAMAMGGGFSASPVASVQYIVSSSATPFIYTVAGNGTEGYSGDGGKATLANINYSYGTVVDSAGNLYFSDMDNHRVRKVATGTGIITTVAGNGTAGFSGDSGSATSAQLYFPHGLALDSAGNLYIADTDNQAIRMVTPGGQISTVLGRGTKGNFSSPRGIAIDSSNNIYVSDSGNYVIWKLANGASSMVVFAGEKGQSGYNGENLPATSATLSSPQGIAVDKAGTTVFIADANNNRVRMVYNGYISTVAGNGGGGYSGDGNSAAYASLHYPIGVALDGSGNIYIADEQNNVIREVTNGTRIISTIAGNGPKGNGSSGDGGPAGSAAFSYPTGISADSTGNLYINDGDGFRIRKVTAASLPPSAPTATPSFSVSAGSYSVAQTVTITDATAGASIYITLDGTTPTTASTGYTGPINVSGTVTLQALAVAPGYLASPVASAVYSITSAPTAVISTVAGSGVSGMSGAGGPATSAQFGILQDLAVDGSGNQYFVDSNNVVWKVSAQTGMISVVAGNGKAGYSGDGSLAVNAELNTPYSVAVDGSGNIYIADGNNSVVRKVTAQTGFISTIAGTGTCNYSGDSGQATAATLCYPSSVRLDGAGNLYIADSGNGVVRMVAGTGVISTVAGNHSYVFSGDNGAATSAGLINPEALALDGAGNLYIGDSWGRIRKVTKATGLISTVAGNGDYGSNGDGGLATSAQVIANGLAIDPAGNLFIANGPGVVREVSTSTGIISTIAGSESWGFWGDGGSATVAGLNGPVAVAFDVTGNLFIADDFNYRVRKVTFAPAATPTFSPAAGSYTTAQSVTIADTTSGATIYYTTDGSTPTTSSAVYSGSIAVNSTMTIQAMAIATGTSISPVASATYSMDTVGASLAFSSSDTNPTLGETVTLTATLNIPASQFSNMGSYWIYDGTTVLVAGALPNTTGPGYMYQTSSLSFGTHTLTAKYVGSFNGVTVTSNPLVVQVTQPAAAPTFSVTAGSYTSVQTVTLSDTTPNATFYYVIGATVTTPTTLYTGPITVSSSETLAAIAVAPGYTQSPIATAAYTVVLPPTVTSLTSPTNPINFGQSITLVATIAGQSGFAPTGTVTFSYKNAILGTVSLGSAGVVGSAASLTTAALPLGSDSLTAVYSGDNFNQGSTSNTVFQVVDQVDSLGYTYSIPYAFLGSPDGSMIMGGTVDAQGNLYGITGYGGVNSCSPPYPAAYGCGAIIKLDSSGRETVLHSFSGTDGAVPMGGLVLDGQGNLYGTTLAGGNLSCNSGEGCGSIFQLNLATLQFTTLHNFTGAPDGSDMESPMVLDWQGNLYGSTNSGGANGAGVLFKVDGSGNYSTIYSFTSAQTNSWAVEVTALDAQGNFYGTTRGGGTTGNGSVFKLNPTTSTFTVLYSFTGGTDGDSPRDLFRDAKGNLFGHTKDGGNTACGVTGGCGTLFKVNAAGTFSILHTFVGGTDGTGGSLNAEDAQGNLFGLGSSTAFVMNTSNAITALHTFTGTNGDGAGPGGLVRDVQGNLYGGTGGGVTTCNAPGGTGALVNGCGTLFKLALPAAIATTTTALQSSAVNAITGQSVTFTATVSASAGTVPNGEAVAFMMGPVLLGAGTLSSGTASFTTSALPLGSYPITAVYAGDPNFAGSLSNSVAQGVTLPVVATPTFSPAAGAYIGMQTVSIFDTTPNSTIYYAINGTATTSSTPYTVPISVSSSETIEAIAVATGYTQSAVATAAYTITYKTTPTITWPTPTAITYGTALSAAQLNATSGGVAGTFVYSPALGAMLSAGPQTLSVIFTPNDTADYTTATASVQLTVNQATPTITWPTPAAIVYGTPLSATQLDATSSVPGSFNYLTPAGTVPLAGTFTLSTTFTPTDTTNYATVTATVQLTVTKATPTISWVAPAAITYGTPLSGTQLNASSSTSGTFAYTPASGVVLGAGPQTLSVTFTPLDPADYNTATASVQLTVNQATPTITWATPAAIPYGTPLSTTQLDASTPVQGTFAYTPALGTVLLPGAQTLSATFTPVDLNYKNATASVQLAVVAASLSFSPTGIAFAGQPINTASAAIPLIVTNLSAFPVTMTSATATGDFSATSSCTTIAPQGTCSVSVTFTPSTTGARTGTLSLTEAQSNVPQNLPLTGTGTVAGIQITPAALNFGSQVVSTTSYGQTIAIQNTGTAPLAVSNIATTGDFATTGNCASVPAGSSCSLTVTFAPTATGTRTGTVTLTDNAGSGSQSQIVNLVGVGTQAGATLTPSVQTFAGTVVGKTSFGLNATLTNTGSATLTGIGVSILGDFTQSNTCGATLAPNTSCTITVTYAPTVAGAETGSLTVTDSLGAQTVTLLGTGLAPGASLSTAQLVFGGQLVNTSSLAQTVIFTNTGTAAVSITSVTPSANFTDSTNCTGSIAAGASCSINAVFAPSTTGALSGTISVVDSVGTQTVNLQGQSISKGLAVSPSVVAFGAQVVGTISQAQTLMVTNTGTTALALNPIAVSNNFVESDQCYSATTTLAAGATCSISLSFSPTAAGNLSGSLVISDTTGTVFTLATASGQGTLPGITTSPSTLSFGSLSVGTTSQAQTVTVTNTGTAALQIGTVTGTGDFAEADTCSNKTINPGKYCVISVTMTPTTTGTRTGAIQFNDNADGLHTIALSGMGQQAGANVSPSSLAFGSLPIVSPSQVSTAAGTSLSVTVSNPGTAPLILSGITPQGDFTESDNCNGSVAAGGSCTLTVKFVPTALGHRTGTLTISDNAGTQLVSLEGYGAPGGLTLTPSVLNFGAQTVGVPSTPQIAVLTNNTGYSITNLTIAASGEYAETDNCGSTLANGASCNLTITVTPLTPGAITGTITISAQGTFATGNVRGILQNEARLVPEANGTSVGVGVVAVLANTNTNITASKLVFGTAPAGIAAEPYSAGSITVLEQDDTGNTVNAQDALTLTVTGSGYSATYPATASGGVATFDLSAAVLKAPGSYTYKATLNSNTAINVSATETLTAGAAASVTAAAGISQSTVINTAFAAALQVLVVDVNGYPVKGATVTFTAPASGPGAGLSSTSVQTDVNGTASVIATANGFAGGYAITAAVSGVSTSASFSLTNNKGTPTLTWATPADITYGTALGTSQLNASAGGMAGSFVYSPIAGTVLLAGSQQLLSVLFTPTDIADYTTATATVRLNVNKATPVLTWVTPAAITVGTQLSTTQLNATASVPGTFVYNPLAGTTPAVGTDTLNVTFTPNDITDYTIATASVQLVVVNPNPVPVIGSMSPAFTSAGGAAFTLTLTGTGFVSGSSTAYWGSTALATTFVSATQLTAQVPAASFATAGTTAVTVKTVAPGGGTSNALNFEVDTAGSTSGAPTFTTLTATVTAGSSATYSVTLPSTATSVSASCLNLPTGATCTYSSTSNTVTITTASTTPTGTYQIIVVFTETLPGVATGFILLPILLLPLFYLRRKLAARGVWLTACAGLIVAVATIIAIGCGGGGGGTSTPQTHQVTSSGTVTLTVH